MSDTNQRIIARCGLVCNDCKGYIATQANDEEFVAKVAEEWSSQFNTEIKPESVWCDGCITEGRKCGHCVECEIRTCANEKEMINCGACPDMDNCETIQNFIKMVPCVSKVLGEFKQA